MEGRISQVTLVVRHQAKSLEFYTVRVGFELKNVAPLPGGRRWVTVGPKGQALELALFELGSPTDPAQTEGSKNWSPGTSPPHRDERPRLPGDPPRAPREGSEVPAGTRRSP